MTISFARHQFPTVLIRHAVWLYVRFTLSYRDVEDLLAERGLDVSYETVRRWVLKFGPLFARELRRRRPRPTSRWHLDEIAVTIAGRQFWLRRAILVFVLGSSEWEALAKSANMMRHEANKPVSPALGIFSPLRYAVFRRIWTASLLSNLGLLVLGVGAAWTMTKISSSTGMVALVQTSLMLPVALVSTPAGAIADMFDRRIVGRCSIDRVGRLNFA